MSKDRDADALKWKGMTKRGIARRLLIALGPWTRRTGASASRQNDVVELTLPDGRKFQVTVAEHDGQRDDR